MFKCFIIKNAICMSSCMIPHIVLTPSALRTRDGLWWHYYDGCSSRIYIGGLMTPLSLRIWAGRVVTPGPVCGCRPETRSTSWQSPPPGSGDSDSDHSPAGARSGSGHSLAIDVIVPGPSLLSHSSHLPDSVPLHRSWTRLIVSESSQQSGF